MSLEAANAPITHFANCHVGIFAQLDRMGDLPALLGPAAQARKIAEQSLAFFSTGMYTHHSEEEKDLFTAVRASANGYTADSAMSFTLTSLALVPNPATPIVNGVDNQGDSGRVLADFGPTGLDSGFSYSVVRVVDNESGAAVSGKAVSGFGAYNSSQYLNPASDPWFYLNSSTGRLGSLGGAEITDEGNSNSNAANCTSTTRSN
mgnify:CR=1 FL=1